MAKERKHHWSNDPNGAHKVCTMCGARKDLDNKRKKWVYTDRDGNVTDTPPDCVYIDYSEFY